MGKRKPGRRFEWHTGPYGDKHEIRVDPATGEYFASAEGEAERGKDLGVLREWIDRVVEKNRQADWEPVIMVHAAGGGWPSTTPRSAYRIEVRRYYRVENKAGKYRYRRFVPECRHFLHPWRPKDHPGEEHPDRYGGTGEGAAFPRRGCWPHVPGPTCSPYIPVHADVLPYSHDTWRRLETLRLFLERIGEMIPGLLGDNLARTLEVLGQHAPGQLLLEGDPACPTDTPNDQ